MKNKPVSGTASSLDYARVLRHEGVQSKLTGNERQGVDSLIEHYHGTLRLDSKDRFERNPVCHAAMNNMTFAISAFCMDPNRQSIKKAVNEPDVLGNTALHYAAERGDQKHMRMLHNAGALLGPEAPRMAAELTSACEAPRLPSYPRKRAVKDVNTTTRPSYHDSGAGDGSGGVLGESATPDGWPDQHDSTSPRRRGALTENRARSAVPVPGVPAAMRTGSIERDFESEVKSIYPRFSPSEFHDSILSSSLLHYLCSIHQLGEPPEFLGSRPYEGLNEAIMHLLENDRNLSELDLMKALLVSVGMKNYHLTKALIEWGGHANTPGLLSEAIQRDPSNSEFIEFLLANGACFYDDEPVSAVLGKLVEGIKNYCYTDADLFRAIRTLVANGVDVCLIDDETFPTVMHYLAFYVDHIGDSLSSDEFRFVEEQFRLHARDTHIANDRGLTPIDILAAVSSRTDIAARDKAKIKALIALLNHQHGLTVHRENVRRFLEADEDDED